MSEELTVTDVVAELQQTNTHLETLTGEVQDMKNYNTDIGNSVGICVCLLFMVAGLEMRNLVLSWTKKGVKDV